jgi:serine/threonine protein kinase
MLDALPPGTVFADRYEVVRCIGKGGMGAVYEVVHTRTQRRRAMKILHPGLMSRRRRARALREGGLDHGQRRQ